MKRFILFSFLSLILIFCLNTNWGNIPALGSLLDPYHGCWQNVVDDEKDERINLGLNEKVELKFNDRLIPFIKGKTSKDAYKILGYLHAKYRLWQMDITTRLASGRLSEIIGEQTIDLDRYHRRIGMVYGAENSLQTMMKDEDSKQALLSYSAGVNEYIQSLSKKDYPLEYKIIGHEPEAWTPLKTCLVLKYMANTLSGNTDDFSLTIAKNALDEKTFRLLYPNHRKEEYPIIKETQNIDQLKRPEAPKSPNIKIDNAEAAKTESSQGIGSNNWVIGPQKSSSGNAILCNDPHLPINLPSIWYECGLQIGDNKAYGVSLPGAPGIIIGFNQNISWGFTNGYRDVMDYYSIKKMGNGYDVDGLEKAFSHRIEEIKIKGQKSIIDSVLYTEYGPLTYDQYFPSDEFPDLKLATQWMAHRGTNELQAIRGLNKAKNYADYVAAIAHFECPHQNIVYADTKGNIALWSQGLFINKWNEQGRYVMDGSNSLNNWGEIIPQNQNPHEKNPQRGWIMSANQMNTDATYPYYYNGIFHEMRSKRLENLLTAKEKFSTEDLKKMQLDNYYQLAHDALEIISPWSEGAFDQWDFQTTIDSKEAVLFWAWWQKIRAALIDDEYLELDFVPDYPNHYVLMEILKNERHPIIDDKGTQAIEERSDILKKSFSAAQDEVQEVLDTHPKDAWAYYKSVSLEHIGRIPGLGIDYIPIEGGRGIVNAASSGGAPSWRMIVEMGNPIKAYVVYPGGQSGHPSSAFYKNQVEHWRSGQYYEAALEFGNSKAFKNISFY